MLKTVEVNMREISVLVVLAMLFAAFSVLSLQLNYYFIETNLLGLNLPLNVSVIFFCLGFFVIDIITELFNNSVANIFIYGKILAYITFVVLGYFALSVSNVTSGELIDTFRTGPYTLFSSAVASLAGYSITSKLMFYFRIKFKGRFLFSRYLMSTLPGETVFSLIFGLMTFTQGRDFSEFVKVFLTLLLVKYTLSILFSLIISPITSFLKYFVGGYVEKIEVEEKIYQTA